MVDASARNRAAQGQGPGDGNSRRALTAVGQVPPQNFFEKCGVILFGKAPVAGQEPVRFETPCPPLWTAEFVSSLQRALKARGIYNGEVSGMLDTVTHDAIRVYQMTHGLNSDVLSTDHARALRLVEVNLASDAGLPG